MIYHVEALGIIGELRMFRRIKCLFTGHRFLMDYYPAYGRYYPHAADKCSCCSMVRREAP